MLLIEWKASADADLFEIHPNYIVLYRVAATCIEVVNVVHARREFPGQ